MKTREEEIKNEAVCYLPDLHAYGSYNTGLYVREAFMEGAKWADEHPKNPWISVKKRPPEENETVLLWLGGCYKVALLRDCIWWECTGFQTGRWWSALDALSIREVESITHWMPIPELPKGE